MAQSNESAETAVEVAKDLTKNADSKSVISVAGAALAFFGGVLLINRWRRNRD